MTIQTVNDSIVAKGKELDVLLAKEDPTMEDVSSIKELGAEIKTLKGQLADLEEVEELRKAQATAKKSQPKADNDVKTAPRVEVKGSRLEQMPKEQKQQFVAGRYIQAAIGRNEQAKNDLAELGIELKTHTESNDATGGILVPNEVSNYIIDLKEQYGVFRRNTRVERMGSETKTVYRMGDDITTYWGSETGTLTASDMSFSAINLTARKLYAYAIVSDELNADASIDMGRRFAESVARQFAYAEDNAGFNGDGTSTYGGITGVRSALTNLSGTIANIAGLTVGAGNAYSEITLQNFVDTKAKLPEYARQGAKWYMSRDAYAATYERLVMAAGGITAQEVLNGVTLERALGYPVELVEVMPKTEGNSQVFALFGRLDLATTMGDRMGTAIKTDMSAGFNSDTIHIKATERIDIVTHDVGNASATASARVPGPIVGLITAAS